MKRGGEERRLLVEALYRHVAYGVVVDKEWLKYPKGIGETHVVLAPDMIHLVECGIYDVVPYLYPVSALTEADCDELMKLVLGPDEDNYADDWIKFRQDGDIEFIFYRRSYKDVWKLYEWLYRHHFDVDGLIGKGLARDASDVPDAYGNTTK